MPLARLHRFFLAASTLMFATVGAAWSEVRVSPLFSSNMVLQRDRLLPVWGTALPGEKITVEFLDQKLATTAGHDGRWQVVLHPEPAHSQPSVLRIAGENTITASNVVVGDVWLCSGQSNMAMRWKFTTRFEQERSSADLPLVRQLKIAEGASESPQITFAGQWQVCTPQTAGEFSAVAYYFARRLNEKTGVPIGIINASWGGTTIEGWLDGVSANNGFAEYRLGVDRWQKEKKGDRKFQPSGIHNAMVHPLYPAAIRGVVWYQGESNVWWPDDYFAMFQEMLSRWREGFQQPDLPFYTVQLPGFADKRDATGVAWARLREQQSRAAALPGVTMIVTIDQKEPDRLHPNATKDAIGQRLAAAVLEESPGSAEADLQPCFEGVASEGASLKLSFKSAGGFRLKGSEGFEVAGEDRIFRPAIARIDGEAIVVSSPDVPHPVAVRYAWTNAPAVSLYGSTGLSMPPFRSDAW